MLPRLAVVTLVVSAIACSTNGTGSSASSSSSGSTDAGIADAGPPDSGHVCRRTDAGTCVDVEWNFYPDLPHAVDHHSTFIHDIPGVGPYLYVAGGIHTTNAVDDAMYTEVYRAPLAFMSATPWEVIHTLPAPVAFHAQAQRGDTVYWLAGVTRGAGGASASRAVHVVKLDATGALSITAGPTLPAEVRTHATAHIIGDTMYLVGGGNSAGSTRVNVSTLDGTGMPGTWSDGPALPRARSHHGGLVHDGRIYLVAGFDQDQVPVDAIHRSVHDGSGALTGWEQVGVLDDPPWTPGVFEMDGHLWMLGGGTGTENLERARHAPFNTDGTVGEWADASPMIFARSHVHQVPVHGREVYSVGGRTGASFTSTENVLVGWINHP